VKFFGLTSAMPLLLCIIAISTTAQENTAELKHFTAAPLNGSRPVSLTALSIEHGSEYPRVIGMKGSVEIKTPVCLPVGKKGASVCDGEMVVHADEAEFHEDTGEIQARGNVQITPLHHRKQ
jgi:hypothetical protein